MVVTFHGRRAKATGQPGVASRRRSRWLLGLLTMTGLAGCGGPVAPPTESALPIVMRSAVLGSGLSRNGEDESDPRRFRTVVITSRTGNWHYLLRNEARLLQRRGWQLLPAYSCCLGDLTTTGAYVSFQTPDRQSYVLLQLVRTPQREVTSAPPGTGAELRRLYANGKGVLWAILAREPKK